MPSKNINDYISHAAEFAKPILTQIRKVVHEACPEVEESIKWSFPHFLYRGSILCSMASFKQHCAFGFWLSDQMEDPDSILHQGKDRPSMGNLGKITGLSELPDKKILIRYIVQAMKLTEQGVKLVKKKTEEKELIIPEQLLKALSKNKLAKQKFESFPISHKREYVEWIAEAKTEATRDKRIHQAIEWIAEGKGRNWKYEKR